MSVMLLIADTIQKADKSYLFEDYTKQALAVVQALKSEGYIVVPRKATEAMLEAGEKSRPPPAWLRSPFVAPQCSLRI